MTQYLVAVHQDRPDGPYGVSVPDLPGCTAVEDTLAAALASAAEAIGLWIEDAIENGEPIPQPSPCIDPEGGRVAIVSAPDVRTTPPGTPPPGSGRGRSAPDLVPDARR